MKFTDAVAISPATYAKQRGVHKRTVIRWIHEGRPLGGTLGVTRTLGGHIRIWISRKRDERDERT